MSRPHPRGASPVSPARRGNAPSTRTPHPRGASPVSPARRGNAPGTRTPHARGASPLTSPRRANAAGTRTRRRRLAPLTLALALAAALSTPTAASAAPSAAPACPLSIGAPSAIVLEVTTGSVACARGADRRRPIASATKLMTALLTLERVKLSDVFTAPRYRASPVESKIGLQPGERMRVADLMRGLLVESANDAAVTLADGIAGSRRAFVRLMNQRARQLGLRNTHYVNPVGLDERGNYSSARDLVTLALVLRTNRFFKKVVDSPQVTLKSGAHPRTFANRNDLVRRYPFVNGVKTGHTVQAGYVLVGSARRAGVQLVSAVLGTPSEAARDADTLALFKLGFHRFQRIRVVVGGRTMAEATIRYRNGARLRLIAAHTVRRVILRGHRDAVGIKVTAPSEVQGPIRRGQRLGRIEVSQGGRLVATVPLVAAAHVPAAGIAQQTKNLAAAPLVLIGVAFAAVGGTLLVARRRQLRSRRPPSREARAA